MENYKEARLINNAHMSNSMKSISSQNHENVSYKTIKVSMPCFADKNIASFDGINN